MAWALSRRGGAGPGLLRRRLMQMPREREALSCQPSEYVRAELGAESAAFVIHQRDGVLLLVATFAFKVRLTALKIALLGPSMDANPTRQPSHVSQATPYWIWRVVHPRNELGVRIAGTSGGLSFVARGAIRLPPAG